MLAVEMKHIYKTFGPVKANQDVNFELEQGEIHALLGENGAGKTTLMRILYGLYKADSGEIFINGEKVNIHSPKEAIAAGVGMVTQHFTLVPTLTVAENIVLGYSNQLVISQKDIETNVQQASEKYGIPVDPSALVRNLSVGERQRVEILKALYRNARILIMDEPTAVLVPQEVDALFEALVRLVKSGLSVIFISHKLIEVMAVCDRITVLRDGKVANTVKKAATTQVELAKMMVGRETFGVQRQNPRSASQPVYELTGISLEGKHGRKVLDQVSFNVGVGEILGIAGVSGNGQGELTEVLTGLVKPTEGSIKIDGRDITNFDPGAISNAGIGRTPQDRHEGTIGDLTVAENLALEHISSYTNKGMLDRKKIQEDAAEIIHEFQIKASPGDQLRKLSGGNMQKVVLARALSRKPRVLIASQPTRGLDVGATEYVRKRLLEERDRGTAVVLLSEDLDEVLALSDRIAVIYEGSIRGIIPAAEATPEKLGLLMAGAA
ncbi:MAG TPA: ABC transporter ATP-binding protein [Anaerolineaceae bacterium]|nr:ABC transporter ATP-binding protein [Anaerolineaceae bacterium]